MRYYQTTPRLNLRIGNGTVDAQNIYDETEDALMTSLGMEYIARGNISLTIALLPTGTFLFLQDNVRLLRDNPSDSSATVEAFVTSTQSLVLDSINGDVQFVTVTRAQQLIEYNGHIFVDVDSGSNESTYPFGTQANPVNSWENAKILCDFYGVRDVKFTGTMLHTSDAVGFMVEGSDAGATLVLQGHDISKSAFRNLIMRGDAGNPSQGTQLRESYADSITNWNGVMDSVIITGPVTVTGERNYLTRCSSAVVDDSVVIVTINNGGQCSTSIRDWHGRLSIGGVSNALNTVSIDSDSGDIELLPSNTAGNITLRGQVTTFVDNSTGSTVSTAFVSTQSDIDSINFPTVQEVVDGVWDEPLTGATHNNSTSAGRRLRQASAWLSAEGQAIGTPTVTSIQTDLTQTESGFYADQTFVFTSGDLAGQARLVTSYDGVTKTFTFDEPWLLAPGSSDEFAVLADHVHSLSHIQNIMDQSLINYDGPTRAEVTSDKDEIITEINANESKIDSIQTSVDGLNDFDPETDEVITDSASREASKADVSSLGTKADLTVINNGVKKSSKIIPHNEDLL